MRRAASLGSSCAKIAVSQARKKWLRLFKWVVRKLVLRLCGLVGLFILILAFRA